MRGIVQRGLSLIAFLTLVANFQVCAQSAQPSPVPSTQPAGDQNAKFDEKDCTDPARSNVTTQHSITLNGKKISYSVTAGFTEVSGADESSKACIFSTSYQMTDTDPSSRPIIFAFNGGPGSSSIWLHMGALGPKRVDLGPDGLTPPKHPTLIANEYSPLDIADIVMIDPVSTGFSHAEDPAKKTNFYGSKNDYISIANFIRIYLTANNRWLSPKFIMGESYGGARASLLVHHLQSDYSILVDGAILVSPFLSTTPFNFNETSDNTVPFWTSLPSFAVAAWYHHKIASQYQNLQLSDVYTQAQAFATTSLRDALDKGNQLSPQDYSQIAQKISDFTGIPEPRVENLNLKISFGIFINELLQKEQLEVGAYDSRAVGSNFPGNPQTEPSTSLSSPMYASGLNYYLKNDLKVPYKLPYIPLANLDITNMWKMDSSYGADGQLFSSTEFSSMDDLSQAFADNPNFKLMIGSGYFDLVVSMGSVDYELSHLASPKQNFLSRVTLLRMPGGHMFYTNPAALQSLRDGLGKFIGN